MLKILSWYKDEKYQKETFIKHLILFIDEIFES